MKRVKLSKLQEAAASKPAGYLEAVKSAGVVRGEYVELSDDAYEALRLKYSPRGVGDVVARFAQPIANAIGLGECGGCKSRQAWLNEKLPFKA